MYHSIELAESADEQKNNNEIVYLIILRYKSLPMCVLFLYYDGYSELLLTSYDSFVCLLSFYNYDIDNLFFLMTSTVHRASFSRRANAVE